ncbi:MAG: hypothetical protein OHM77_02935 [Candidatus Nitricoxidivorans perseverans]|uniref:Uncharacterized protein n=1 Tax=Candidatus Nitricoxidivorans perseverans TaxID=2975601 RepID=A0AA49FLW6_9PROT|nr:MAG: hypothetical protein OHM77_02935 [Candidatus Nitricoxidivorans perseverans]
MKDIPTELLYVLMFLVVVLFQYLMKRFVPQEPAWDERLEQIPEVPEDAPAAPAAFAPVDGQFGRNAAPATSLAPPRRHFSRSSLMGSRREVQNAVVVATILGPCRAFESHDIRQ